MSDTTTPPLIPVAGMPAGPSREKLIEAAARVYALVGFRGATTRRIAEEAGVNEVTIFRLFGSKAALIDAAMRQQSEVPHDCLPPLPDHPTDPERELTAWCEAQLTLLRDRRCIIRQTMGEMAERPELAPCATQGATHAGAELKRYMRRLYALGLAERSVAGEGEVRDEEAHAAGAMLMAALFGDAMGRDMMPDLYPQPAERAAALYVRVFLRAIRCTTS